MSDRCNVLNGSDGLHFRVINSDRTCNEPSVGCGIWMESNGYDLEMKKGGTMTTVYPCAKHFPALMEHPFDGAHYAWFRLMWVNPSVVESLDEN